MSEKSGRSDSKLSESSSISELQAADLSIFSGSFDGGVFSSNLPIFDLMGARNQNNSLYSPHPFVKSNGPCRLTAITQSTPKEPLNMTPADFGLADFSFGNESFADFTANNSSFVGNFQSNVRSTRLLPSWAVDMSGNIRDDLTLQDVVRNGSLIDFAMDRTGVKFLESHFPSEQDDEMHRLLFDKLTEQSKVFTSLCRSAAGNFIIQKFVEHASLEEQDRLVSTMSENYSKAICLDKFACRVSQPSVQKVDESTETKKNTRKEGKPSVSTEVCNPANQLNIIICFWDNQSFAGNWICQLTGLAPHTQFSSLIPSFWDFVKQRYGSEIKKRDVFYTRILRTNIGASKYIDPDSTIFQIWRDVPLEEKHVHIRFGSDVEAILSACSDKDSDEFEEDSDEFEEDSDKDDGFPFDRHSKRSGSAAKCTAGTKGVVVSTKNETSNSSKAVTTSTLSKTPVSSVRSLAKNSGFSTFQKRADALVCQVIRNNNAFLRTQRGIGKRFFTEKFNLKKVNSPKYSGLANKHVIDVSAGTKGVVVSTKNENLVVIGSIFLQIEVYIRLHRVNLCFFGSFIRLC